MPPIGPSGPSLLAGANAGDPRPQTARPWSRQSTSRPQTAQMRPPTRPQTAMSSRHEASYVVAVIEARGIGREVGIAALDRDTARVNLIQVRTVFSLGCLAYVDWTAAGRRADLYQDP